MALKHRLEALEKALAETKRHKARQTDRIADLRGKGLEVVYREHNGRLLEYLQVTDAGESLSVEDIILGVGGAYAWANSIAGANRFGDEYDRAVGEMLGEFGFIQVPDSAGAPRWEPSSPETELAFMVGWLEAADRAGRKVTDRDTIEARVTDLRGKMPLGNLAPVAHHHQQADMSDALYEERIPTAQEVEIANRLEREAGPKPAPTMTEVQAALQRRNVRLGYRQKRQGRK